MSSELKREFIIIFFLLPTLKREFKYRSVYEVSTIVNN